jgi:prepilin-type N-terminal cleavage/methylation domain-containing protein
MKKKNIFAKGLTLIELLVVVAIIAILVSVVLTFLGGAKNKGTDAGVKTNLHTVVSQAELFFINNNSYLPTGGTNVAGVCPTYGDGTVNMFSQDKTMADAMIQAINNGNGSYCYNSADAWAVAVGLNSGTSLNPLSWCVDNSGASSQVSFLPENAVDEATFLCK